MNDPNNITFESAPLISLIFHPHFVKIRENLLLLLIAYSTLFMFLKLVVQLLEYYCKIHAMEL